MKTEMIELCIEATEHMAYSIAARAELAAIRQTVGGLADACRKAMAVMPGLEVRNWPPGFRLRDGAMADCRQALAKAESM